MIASLPMYDWPEVNHIHDAFWQLLRNNLLTRGIEAPELLSRSYNEGSDWTSPDLFLSQTCGYPFATLLRGRVQYLATPVYGVAGCENGYYASAIITRTDSKINLNNIEGSRFAYNSTNSWSGYRTVIREYGNLEDKFGLLVESQGHRNSARMVAHGEADVAALDAVCWHLLQHYEPETAGLLKVIAWTKMHPSLPLITSLETSQAVAGNLVEAIEEVLASNEFASFRGHLPLVGCVKIDPEIYMDLGRDI